MSEYKEEIDKMQWSYSRLTTFEQCKYEFYLNYILHDKKLYPPESNYYADVGLFVHKILAKILKGELDIDKAAQYYVDNFDIQVTHKVKQTTMDKTFELCADYFATVDFDWLKDYDILGVEKEVKFQIEDYNFIGYIDLLLRDKRDGKIVVIDHKSGKYPFKLDGTVKSNAKQDFDSYKKQIYLYCRAVKEEFGEFPKEMSWNFFKDNAQTATIPFSKKEYNAAMKWLINSIHEIEDETDYDATLDYFYCNNLCNFRYNCEYCQTAEWK